MEGLDLFRIFQSVFGIGLVVFVHELGHYIAARLCGVRVETFSLGFGPKLIAWRRGPTLYQIAAIPLGGFCRMAGEERRYDSLPPEPDELPAKSVGQRFVIYAAGVAMNVAFVIVVFPIIFRIGVPFLEPRIGVVVPGGPAWMAGVREGEEVLAVNGSDVFKFMQIPTEIALGEPDRTELLLRDPATGIERSLEMVPERNERMGLYTIGIGASIERDPEGHPLLMVRENSKAWEAGLRTGMALTGVGETDAWLDAGEQLGQAKGRGGTLELFVTGEEGAQVIRVQPEVLESSTPRAGITPPWNHVVRLRGSAVDSAVGLLEGDRILAANGSPVFRRGDFRRALRAGVESPTELLVLRDGEEVALRSPSLSLEEADRFAEDVAVVNDLESTAIVVQAGEAAAAAGLQDGDVVREIDGTQTLVWSDVRQLVANAGTEGRGAAFSIERVTSKDGPPLYSTIDVVPAPAPGLDYGIGFRDAEYLYRVESTAEAVQFGFYSSWKLANEMWLTLKRLITADVDSKNLGGIIAISQVTYSSSDSGWPKFFFFLCLLSMNLAFVNLLPIPVLDGGHLFFLIVEKIKGSPVSERVFGYSQMVGVVLILSLMIYVTYNDLMRLIPGG